MADTVAMGSPISGFRVGILTLNTTHSLKPGNVQNATTFQFPVVYAVVRDVSIPSLLNGQASALGPILAAIAELEDRGVSVIVGACGSFIHFQEAATRAARVPVFLSIMLEVPLLLRTLPAQSKLGIIFASAATFSPRVCDQSGISDTSRIIALGADEIEAFRPILSQSGVLDSLALERGIVELVQRTIARNPSIAAWLLQCSDLPPYAAAIRSATNRPVFDMALLIEHLHGSAARRIYTGEQQE
jgi:hypothetical protein